MSDAADRRPHSSLPEYEPGLKVATVVSLDVDRQKLQARLAQEFAGSERERHVVAREARDLADSGQLAADLDVDLTVETIVSNLADAPDDDSVAERWNWWIDSLTLSHGGYQRFRVRTDVVQDEN